jgi:hypothetical protein
MGAGRSDTTLVAGLFRLSALLLGDAPHKARQANPHGFFEDREGNSINEALLASCLPQRVESGVCGRGHDVPGHSRPVQPHQSRSGQGGDLFESSLLLLHTAGLVGGPGAWSLEHACTTSVYFVIKW